jgi:acyl-[acyl-carrier-protein]-phospholipid O-acyltransferase / long-chain-fatty-acid--[acyl-carrier-protein] ligase
MTPPPRTIILPRAFLRRCHRSLFAKKVADSTGMQMTGGSLLMRTLIFRRLLLRGVLEADEKFVGLLIPPLCGGVLANAAVTLCRRVAVNLNYTVTSDILNYCIEQCSIRHVLTSRKFMERFDFKLKAKLIYLEDFRDQVTTADKLVAALDTYLLPSAILERWLGLDKIQPDDLFTIIFTSGSTGRPKGVMLSYKNIGTNVAAIEDILQLGGHDTLCGILPLFHSMGFTVGLWAVLGSDVKGAYHFSPLDAKIIGKLCQDHKITIIVSTPTFLRSYLRRCTPEEFSCLTLVVTGAEKLPGDLLKAFEEKFGIRPMEGYGTTELSPIVSLNIPPNRAIAADRTLEQVGTVGKPIPGVTARIVDHETGEDLGVGRSGMLLIKGPNVMQGYYKQPEQSAKVLRDGWYTTGDMAMLDAEGFIHITGRLSRFSKIGGEMVPHIHVEELLQRILSDDEEKLAVAVTSVPDQRKGERLIVFYLHSGKTPDQIVKELAAAHLPNLWIPSPDSFFEVEQIPVLGTGKLDLQAIKELAKEKVAVGPTVKQTSTTAPPNS